MPRRPTTHRPFRQLTPRHSPVDENKSRWGRGRGGRPWQRLRQRIFERDNYLCQKHLKNGRYVFVELHGPSERVGYCDHDIAGGPDTEDNLQTLCKECHDQKTQRESREAAKVKKRLK